MLKNEYSNEKKESTSSSKFTPFSQMNFDGFKTPENFLDLFFPEQIFQFLTDKTNNYADTFIKSLKDPKIKTFYEKQWYPGTTSIEMRKFLGLIILMGMLKTPKISDYWRRASPLSNKFICSVMTYTRFKTLSKFLHFTDNTKENCINDKFFKVRPLLNLFGEIWIKNYCAKENICIDQTDLPLKGNIKIFALADSVTGYIIKWQTFDKGDDYESSFLNQIVLHLLSGFENKGFHLYLDSFFTSISLMKELDVIGVGATGTVRKHKKNFPSVNTKNLNESNPFIFKKLGSILFIVWKERKEIYMLTNKYDEKMIQKNSKGIYEKPYCIENYNKYLHGVGLANQQTTYYRFQHKSFQWYKNIFYYILEITINNCYLIYKQTLKGSGVRILKYQEFRLFIVEFWISLEDDKKTKAQMVKETSLPTRLTERHFLEEICNKKRRDCRVCSKRIGIRIKAKYCCKQCKVALCPTQCFEIFHTMPDFK